MRSQLRTKYGCGDDSGSGFDDVVFDDDDNDDVSVNEEDALKVMERRCCVCGG